MIRLIIVLLILAAAMLFGPELANHQGYMLIAVGDYTIEMSVITAAVIAVAFYIVLLIIEAVLSRVFGIRRGLRVWWRKRGYQKAQRQTQKGVTALAEGEYQRAESLMLRSAAQSDLPMLNYLSAAEAAHAQKAFDKRDDYLQKAAEADPQAQLAIRLTQARLLQDQGEWQQSRELLEELKGRWPRHPQILQRLQAAYAALADWQAEIELLPALKKAQLIDESAEQSTLKRNYQTQFNRILEQSQDAASLLSFWDKQPRVTRHDSELQLLLVDTLIAFGHHQQAFELLLPQLKKNPSDAIWKRCGQLQLKDYAALQTLLLKQVKNNAQAAELLSALGHLYFRQQQPVLAQGYLERSLAIRAASSDRRLLAQIMEQQRLFEKAAEYYRLSLS